VLQIIGGIIQAIIILWVVCWIGYRSMLRRHNIEVAKKESKTRNGRRKPVNKNGKRRIDTRRPPQVVRKTWEPEYDDDSWLN